MVAYQIAMICHEANRAYCASLGDRSQPPWDEAPDWQRLSAINGVAAIMCDPRMPPSASHASWMAEKLANGWCYGPTKDAEAKTHPCMVPYEQLPEEQRLKDHIFGAIVRACIGGAE